ncbi:hypothetical protein KEX41_28210 (plasmid) [Burkholderia thailandensis]|uniref:hypothetical protein n=1 Tax=Burkholderia thailandensis TaxID=57975 RepID=UPI00192DFA74|nr:hypothetical protein [Burkholderia thailandensis]MBS2132074.1 hypothetical protein [Burkholderia thailandensis]QRA15188.1 hypothetical protein JMY07_30245 [Burkholderia thailandensis]
MSAQLVERWEGAGRGARYQIDVERFEPRPGREYFNVRLMRNARAYENTLARTAGAARERVDHAVHWGLAYGTASYRRTFCDARLAPPVNDAEASPVNRAERAARLALFLIERTGSRAERWSGALKAEEQQVLFGRVLGDGQFTIDADAQCIRQCVPNGPGSDGTATTHVGWSEL